MSQYPKVDDLIRTSCMQYRNGVISLNDIKMEFWNAAQQIVSLEDRAFREDLLCAESELDHIQFTVDEKLVPNAAIAVVQRIEDALGPPQDSDAA